MRIPLLLALSGFGLSCASAPDYPPGLPAEPDRKHPDLFVDAIQVWRLGRDYLKGTSEEESGLPWFIGGPEYTDVFSGVDCPAAFRFLEYPYLQNAVHFGCVVTLHPYEDALEAGLGQPDPARKLQALVLLMRVSAPHSVELQWKALNELEDLPARPGLPALLQDLKARFSESAIGAALQRQPPEDRYEGDSTLSWNARAAGILRLRRLLPRLVELSRGEHLHVSLAAERSLEDFEGPEGDEALAQCLLGWQYDAYVRAGRALLVRNAPLLKRVLAAETAPDKCRYWQGILLARCDDPAAVPILCEAIPKTGIIDAEMFEHIARLARAEHFTLIWQLPQQVRVEQRERARQIRDEQMRKLAPR
jgi:hypothetical protein